jgi:hypothetical protein
MEVFFEIVYAYGTTNFRAGQAFKLPKFALELTITDMFEVTRQL